jgi:hypothetical protein
MAHIKITFLIGFFDRVPQLYYLPSMGPVTK